MYPFTLIESAKKRPLHNKILTYLIDNSSSLDGNALPSYKGWLSTRQIADAHDISIYKARHVLIELLHEHKVMVSDRSMGKSLRWFPHP